MSAIGVNRLWHECWFSIYSRGSTGEGSDRSRIESIPALSDSLHPLMGHASGHASTLHPSDPDRGQRQQHSGIGSQGLLELPARLWLASTFHLPFEGSAAVERPSSAAAEQRSQPGGSGEWPHSTFSASR